MDYSPETVRKTYEILEKEVATINRSLTAYEEAKETKVDSKTQTQLTWWQNEITKSREKYERDVQSADQLLEREIQRVRDMIEQKKATIKKDFDKAHSWNSSMLASVSDKLPPKPERIIRMEIRLREAQSEMDRWRMFLEAYKKTEQVGYVFTTIIPESTWRVSEALEEEALRVRNSRPEPEVEIDGDP